MPLNHNSDRPEVVVVGAGPGGLAASLLLSKTNARVRVVERRESLGGRTSGLLNQGFRFDVGPTFFLYPRVLEEIFQAVGHNLMQEVPMVKLDPQYRLVFGAGGQLDATPNIELMESRIRELSPGDAWQFTKYMQENRRKLELFRPILESEFQGIKDCLKPSVMRAFPYLKPWRSLGQELASYFKDPRLQIAFSFQSKYLGMSPFRCPSLFSILSFLEYEHGVFHPIGGCHRIMERMGEIAQELGVEFMLNTEINGVNLEERSSYSSAKPLVKGLKTTQGDISCDACVINADFAGFMSRFIPDSNRTRWTNKKLAKKSFSCSTFMMYLGVKGTFPELAHHTIYIAKDYQKNLREIEIDQVLPEDPSIYVQNACITDNTLAPADCSTLYILAPVPHLKPGMNWEKEKQAFRHKVLQQLRKIGIEDIEDKIICEKIITPQDWQQDHHIYKGSTFNLSHGLNQMLYNRPNNRFEDLNGVYLVGGGTHPGSGLPVIFESAKISTRLLAQDLGLTG